MSATAHVLLLTGDKVRRQAWEAALEGRCQVLLSADESAAATLDVIITDQPLSTVAVAIGEDRLTRGETGLIAVGTGIPADVSLPADHSPRELRLACLLLTEIVRLRRQRETARRKEKVLSHLALSDPLTGLPNRRAWEQQLAARQGRAGEGVHYCLVLFDIDHFKLLNDEQGHVAGDACLKGVAARLAAAVRRGDFVARLGGDEFAALLEGVDKGRAEEVVDRIRRAGGSADTNARLVTLSAGWIDLPAGSADVDSDDALRRADAALRAAKQAGRNTTRGG